MEEQGRDERGTEGESRAERVARYLGQRGQVVSGSLEEAVLSDGDDPLVAASEGMRGPGDGPAERAALAAELEAAAVPVLDKLEPEVPMERRFVVRRQDGSVAFVAAPGAAEGDENLIAGEGETVRHELVPAGVPAMWVEHSRTPFNEWVEGDPGDEQGHVDRQTPENVETRSVYAIQGQLTDDEVEALEGLGIDVVEFDPGENTDLSEPETVRDVADDGTVREFSLMAGGARGVDLRPRRHAQVWMDVRVQYVSEHADGDDDTLEETRAKAIGEMFGRFAEKCVAEGFENIEGAAIVSAVVHLLDPA